MRDSEKPTTGAKSANPTERFSAPLPTDARTGIDLPFSLEDAKELFDTRSFLEGDVDLINQTAEWLDHSESVVNYGNALAQLVTDHGFESVQSKIDTILDGFNRKAKLIGLTPTVFSASPSWAAWDLGKQAYFAEHPAESDTNNYELYNPMLNNRPGQKVTNEIINRQIGWEYSIAVAADPDFIPDVTFATKARVDAHIEAAAIEGRELHSYELSDIGQLLDLDVTKYEAREPLDIDAIVSKLHRDIGRTRRQRNYENNQQDEKVTPPTRAHRRVSATGGATNGQVPPTTPPKKPRSGSGDAPKTPEEPAEPTPTPEKKRLAATFFKRIGKVAIDAADQVNVIRGVGLKDYLRVRFDPLIRTIHAKTEARLWKIADRINNFAAAVKDGYNEAAAKSNSEVYDQARDYMREDLDELIEMWRQKKADALARKAERKARRNERIRAVRAARTAILIRQHPDLGRPATS